MSVKLVDPQTRWYVVVENDQAIVGSHLEISRHSDSVYIQVFEPGGGKQVGGVSLPLAELENIVDLVKNRLAP